MLCRAIRTATRWVAARTPAARVGLHQTLANSRETIHTIPRNALARARPAPIFQLEPAAHGRRDTIVGVSECIIMGIPIPLGTGIFRLLQRTPKVALPKSQPLIFPAEH